MPTSQGDSHHVFTELAPLSAQDLVSCSFSSWYGKYKRHVLTRAEVVSPLPEAFVKYLLSDGIQLPNEDLEAGAEANSDYSDWEEEESESDAGTTTRRPREDPVAAFSELHELLKHKISRVNGKFTPKLNWSAPKDATWILPNNTMLCHSVKDLYLLLNASNYIMHDLTETFDGETLTKPDGFKYELVLREWYPDLNPALEFRCFVKNRTLVAISQRDLNYYTFLDELYDQIYDAATSFFETKLQTTFDLDNFIFDIYVPRPFSDTYLIDINPFARVTDSLLFTWNELALIDEKTPDFVPELRLVDEVNTGRFASKEHSENQVPKDIVDATMDSTAMAELAREWNRMMEKEESGSDSDE